jgi:hypothetical protein
MSSDNPHDVTERLPSGLEGQNVPDDFSIPSCGIEDVDRSVFNLFDKVIKFHYTSIDKTVQPVPVLFAGSERFAQLKQKKPIRDKNGIFILPLIGVTKTGIIQAEDLGGLGRGIGQDTGDLIIKTRLDSSDRRYQNIKNKLSLDNQIDVAARANSTLRETTEGGSTVGLLGTRRRVGSREFDMVNGEVLRDAIDSNIVEVITIPFPEFFSVQYEITFWAQYQTQMNSLIEQMMSSYHAQGNQFRLDTDKGYWFVGFIGDEFTSDNNFQDYTEDERVIRYTFTMKTTGYLVASQHPGMRSPFRKYVSAPTIEFGLHTDPGAGIEGPTTRGNGTGDPGKFTLSDVTELDKSGNPVLGRNHSPYGNSVIVVNPLTGGKETRFLRVRTRYQRSGETVLSPVSPDELGALTLDIEE